MDRVLQPPYVTYELQGQSNNNVHVGLQTVGGKVWLQFKGSSGPTDWSVKHRTQDYESEVVDASDYGARYVSARPFFDPTWFGAFRALRDGMVGYQNPDPQRDALTIAEPTPPPNDSLHTIAAVSVIGPSIYACRIAVRLHVPMAIRATRCIWSHADAIRAISSAMSPSISSRCVSARYAFAGTRSYLPYSSSSTTPM